MWQTIWRTLLVYIIVLVIVRIIGKRGIGQLSPFDFVVAIILAELATMPMQYPDLPLWHSILPLLVLALLEIMLSFAALHSYRLRQLLDGQPQIVIKEGRILKRELRKARYNLDDLMAQLREKGYPDVADVETGVLETSGRLSVVPRSHRRPLTPADLGIMPPKEGLPVVLVMDGTVIKENLRQAGRDLMWLERELAGLGLSPGRVFLATMNCAGQLFINELERE
ncbi:MAG: DUF421 domain-containing protein [Bacillota bacterium]|uniref:DUF421 domain-containing protein n=1 Tax=Desulfurispora thermophila TaxID=265470 RepID=UPI0003752A71|nr:DUF421 domain-containing protein [Desulfurispora thermophila]